jgi:hypothetical protein
MKITHSPGPWHLAARDEAGQTTSLELAAFLQVRLDTALSGEPLTIGASPVTFRPRRLGSHRLGSIRYQQFSPLDLANARVLAASAELIAAMKDLVANVPHDPRRPGQVRARDNAIRALVAAGIESI